MADPQPIRPAATVVILRDRPAGPEVLLLRRNPTLVFYGGAWVFPGGRVDAEDRQAGDDAVAAARQAAVREAREEAGLSLPLSALHHFARWITPPGRPRRFDTHYFIAPASGDPVRIDGGEVHAHRWMRPGEALQARERGEIELPAPTFVTLSELGAPDSVEAAISAVRARGVREFVPRDFPQDDGLCYLYAGDAGYERRDPRAEGPRHRLWALRDGWRYEPPGEAGED